MASRVPKIVGRSSHNGGQATLLKLLSATLWKTNHRPIMTSLSRMEKALEHLETNPYYEKYAKNIARLRQTDPEEFLTRIAGREKKSNETKAKGEHERKFQAERSAKTDTAAQGGGKKSSLEDVMKLDLIRDKGKEEIVEIWLDYHKSKDCIAGVTKPEQFDKMLERARKYSTFLLPLPRETGYEFVVSAFTGTKVHMTPLVWYQTHRENAPECLVMTHYLDLKESKGIVLMRGEFDAKSMNAREARCLANELQLYYATDDPARMKLLRSFNERPDEFKHMDLVAQLESITLTGSAIGKTET